MKKKILSVLVLLVVIITISPMTQAQAAVKLSKAKATMEVDSTLKLKISGTKSKVSWKSSDKSVAKVSDKGVVTAKAEGTATITATVDKEKYTCKIIVIDSSTLPDMIGGGVFIGGTSFPVGTTVYLESEDKIDGDYFMVFPTKTKFEGGNMFSDATVCNYIESKYISFAVEEGFYYVVPDGSYSVAIR